MDPRPPPAKLLSFLDRTKFFNYHTVSSPALVLRMKPNIKELSFKDLAAFLDDHGQPAYRTKQIRQWLFQKGATAFGDMTNLSRLLRDQL